MRQSPDNGVSGNGNGIAQQEDEWSAAEKAEPVEGLRERAGALGQAS